MSRLVTNCSHTDRPYFALGFCQRCYEKDYLKKNPGYKERKYTLRREWVKKNKDRCKKVNALRHRTTNRFAKHGITKSDFDSMQAEQEGKCAICLRKCELVIDHCHITGVVRGLLCSKCNSGIGFLGDDPWVIRQAADYVGRYKITIRMPECSTPIH